MLSLVSCAEDKFYDVGGYVTGTVNFKAVNMSLGSDDMAESTNVESSYQLPDRDVNIPIQIYYPSSVNGLDKTYSATNIELDKESEIWCGGYNEVIITFIPSCPEEKEATFTMPDGQSFKATIENPTFIWTMDSFPDNPYYRPYMGLPPIKAISHYFKGKTEYYNVGYIYVFIAFNVRLNPEDNKWYYSHWTTGEPISGNGYLKFTVENLTVGNPDNCISYNPEFSETYVSRSDKVIIPFHVSYTDQVFEYEETLTGNEFLLCGNSEIKFTFMPFDGQEQMILNLPDSQDVILTKEEPSFIWFVSQEDARNYRYRVSEISGQSSYTKDGIVFDCSGKVKMNTVSEIYYDKELGIFINSNW